MGADKQVRKFQKLMNKALPDNGWNTQLNPWDAELAWDLCLKLCAKIGRGEQYPEID